jgi:hypothetical protein
MAALRGQVLMVYPIPTTYSLKRNQLRWYAKRSLTHHSAKTTIAEIPQTFDVDSV